MRCPYDPGGRLAATWVAAASPAPSDRFMNEEAISMHHGFKTRMAAIVLLLALILPGCGGGGSHTPSQLSAASTAWLPPDQEGISLQESAGSLTLPEGSPLHPEDLQIFTSFGTGNVNSDGGFIANINSQTNQLVTAQKSDGSPVLLGLTMLTSGEGAQRSEGDLDLSARTTAITLVFLSPGIATPDRERAALVLQALDKVSELDALEAAIKAALLAGTPLTESPEVKSALNAAVQASLVALGGRPVSARVAPTGRESHILVGVQNDHDPANLQFTLSNFGLRFLQVYRQNLDSNGQPVGSEEPVNSLLGLVSSADDMSVSSVFGGLFSGQIVAPSQQALTGSVSNSSESVRYSVWGPGFSNTSSVSVDDFVSHASVATGATTLFNQVGPTLDTIVGFDVVTRGRGRPTSVFRTVQRVNELIDVNGLSQKFLVDHESLPLARAFFSNLLGSEEGRRIFCDLAQDVGFQEVSPVLLHRLAVIICVAHLTYEVGDEGYFYHMATSRPMESFVGSPGNSRSVFGVTLTWDQATDIDLHIFSPGGEHSYFGNKAISMGSLDFDDRDGFGPEHFSTNALVPGVYRLAVDYFGGQTPTKCYVTVTTDEDSLQFSRTLTRADGNGGAIPSGDTESSWWVADLHVAEDGSVTITPPDLTTLRSGLDRGTSCKE